MSSMGLVLHDAFAVRIAGAPPELSPLVLAFLRDAQDHGFAALRAGRDAVGRIGQIRRIG